MNNNQTWGHRIVTS